MTGKEVAEKLKYLEPAAGDVAEDSFDLAIRYSIAVSLKRLADDVEQIKHGYRFICERWSER